MAQVGEGSIDFFNLTDFHYVRTSNRIYVAYLMYPAFLFRPSIFLITDIDGQWSLWTGWGPCTKACGTGRRHRYRRCDNPPPRGNGVACKGNNEEIAVCNQRACIGEFVSGGILGNGRSGSVFTNTCSLLGSVDFKNRKSLVRIFGSANILSEDL